MDAIKILGSLLASGALSRGSSGGGLLANVLGSALGGSSGGSALTSMLGSMLGGGQQNSGQQQGGGLGGMLGGLLNGGQQQSGGLGGMLGNMLGGSQQQRGGGLGDMLSGMLSGKSGGASQGGMGDMLSGLLGSGSQNGAGLGGLLSASLGKVAESQNPEAKELTKGFLQGSNETEAQEQAKLIIKTMINAAKADGKVDAEEQAKILEKLGDISPEEAAFVKTEFDAPFVLSEFVNEIPRGMEQQIYLMSILAIDLDTQEEAKYLASLASALNLSKELCNQIHEQVGAPKLFE